VGGLERIGDAEQVVALLVQSEVSLANLGAFTVDELAATGIGEAAACELLSQFKCCGIMMRRRRRSPTRMLGTAGDTSLGAITTAHPASYVLAARLTRADGPWGPGASHQRPDCGKSAGIKRISLSPPGQWPQTTAPPAAAGAGPT
jgi:hypothetical protein